MNLSYTEYPDVWVVFELFRAWTRQYQVPRGSETVHDVPVCQDELVYRMVVKVLVSLTCTRY